MADFHGDLKALQGKEFASRQKKVWPEPHPQWNEAIPLFDWLWFAHIYGFGVLFGFTTLYSLFCLVWFRKTVFAKQKAHFVVTNLGLLFAGFGRSLGLLWDPYLSRESTSVAHRLVILILWGTATAFITSAFSVMLLIVLETTKTNLGPPKMRRLRFLVAITLINVLYMVMSDTVVWFYPHAIIMIFICHVVFTIWGMAISVGYLVASFRIWRNLRPSFHISAENDPSLLRDATKLKRLLLFMSTASIFGVLNFAVSLYISVGEFGFFAQGNHARHWPWFAMQTALRILELILTVLIFRIAIYHTKHAHQWGVGPQPRTTTTEFSATSP